MVTIAKCLVKNESKKILRTNEVRVVKNLEKDPIILVLNFHKYKMVKLDQLPIYCFLFYFYERGHSICTNCRYNNESKFTHSKSRPVIWELLFFYSKFCTFRALKIYELEMEIWKRINNFMITVHKSYHLKSVKWGLTAVQNCVTWFIDDFLSKSLD